MLQTSNHITRRRVQYYKDGRPIPEDQAVDANGTLFDGVTARVPLTMADAARDRRARIHDGHGGSNFHKPGPRYLIDDTAAADAKLAGYIDGLTAQQNAWKDLNHPIKDAHHATHDHSIDDEEADPMMQWKDAMSADLDTALSNRQYATDEARSEYIERQSNMWRAGK